jgi:hypothetical protein
MSDMSAIYREEAEAEETIAAYQEMIDSGMAWRMEGSVGRNAMRLIELGFCVLGEHGHLDFYGNYVPSRFEVKPGTKGSLEYAANLQPLQWPRKTTENPTP